MDVVVCKFVFGVRVVIEEDYYIEWFVLVVLICVVCGLDEVIEYIGKYGL